MTVKRTKASGNNLVQCSQNSAGLNCITNCTVNGCNGSVFRSNHRDLHLHCLDNDNRITLLDCSANLLLNLEDLSCCTGLNLYRACAGSCCLRSGSCCRSCSLRSRSCCSLGSCRSCGCAGLFYSYIISGSVHRNGIVLHYFSFLPRPLCGIDFVSVISADVSFRHPFLIRACRRSRLFRIFCVTCGWSVLRIRPSLSVPRWLRLQRQLRQSARRHQLQVSQRQVPVQAVLQAPLPP